MGDVGRPGADAGDGKADAVAYYYDSFHNDWVWDRVLSNGSQFVVVDPPLGQAGHHVWKVHHKAYGAVYTPLLGNMDGNLTDDAGTHGPTDDPVMFSNDDGGGLTGRWKWL